MPQYRSKTSTAGRNMAGARALWRATGMTDDDFQKPIIAIANSFTQFVPGHVHLKDMGQLVAREVERAGGVAKEFNTIAVDDGIAMGHDGMLYSLPSRDIIADSVDLSLWIMIPASAILVVLPLVIMYFAVMREGNKPFPTAPDSDLKSILKALYLQQQFIDFTKHNQGVDDITLQKNFGEFLDRCKPADLDDPTQRPGVISHRYGETS